MHFYLVCSSTAVVYFIYCLPGFFENVSYIVIDLLVCIAFTEDTADQLKDHLIDELDYVLVPDEAWLKFETWYGTVDGQVSLLVV